MSERYYWPCDETHDPVPHTAELSGDEAHHLTRVMRQKCGNLVTLFDGHGREFRAEITDSRKDRVTLRILETRIVDAEPQRQVTIAVSLPKGDRQKWLVEKLTELGCHRLIPLQTERGVAQCNDQVLERLRRQVIEATKQCNRTRLMEISHEKTVGGVMSCECRVASNEKFTPLTTHHSPLNADFVLRLIAHPLEEQYDPQFSNGVFGQCQGSNATCNSLPRLMQTLLPKNILALVGPEGGFTRQEVEQAVALGLQTLDLGPRILRVETAAILLTAILVNG